MTKYFETVRRDGPARMGKLLTEQQISTPALISKDDYVSAGSVYSYATIQDAIAAGEALREHKKLPYCLTFHQRCAPSQPWSCRPRS